MSDPHLEVLRRSLVMAPPDGPATALTNQEAVALIDVCVQAERVQQGITRIVAETEVPAGNAQLRRFIRALQATGRQES